MRLLGAILAGGHSSRFGSDKASALIGGTPMLDVVAARLQPQCDGLVVVGRTWSGLTSTSDLPKSGIGPLGGLAGAMVYAHTHGFDEVLVCPCDMPDIPADLAAQLAPGPAYIEDHWGWSRWPAALAPDLENWLRCDKNRRIRDWLHKQHARPVRVGHAVRNINRPEDI